MKFLPVTKEAWSDFESLFGVRGACGGCWCMLWRLKRSEFEQQKGESEDVSMRIQTGQPAKNFDVEDIFGNPISLNGFKDKKLLLAFFRYASL